MRGLAIVLVVFGHGLRGAWNSEEGAGDVLQAIDWFVYSFHMPAFFYLGGYFTEISLRHRSAASFIRGRWWGIARPYFLWSIIYFMAGQVMSRFTTVNRPINIDQLLSIGWAPIHVLWFLYAFLTCQMLALLGSRAPLLSLTLALAANFAVSAANLQGSEEIFITIARHAPFFFVGYLFANRSWPVVPRFSSLSLMTVTLLFFTIGALSYSMSSERPIQAVTIPVSLLGIAMLAGLSSKIARESPGGAATFATLGRASMAIYLLHILVLAIVPRLLRAVHADTLPARVMVGTIVGTFGSYAIYLLLTKARLAKPLGLR